MPLRVKTINKRFKNSTFPVIQLFQDGGRLILSRGETRGLVETDQGVSSTDTETFITLFRKRLIVHCLAHL